MKAFVINLASAIERRAEMNAWLSKTNIDYEFFNAINGFKLSTEEKLKRYDSEQANEYIKRDLSNGEIGCALSHLEICQNIIDKNIPFALILEDDAAPFCPVEKITALLSMLEKNLDPEKPIVVMLSHAKKYSAWKKSSLSTNQFETFPVWEAFGARAYVITNKGAELLKLLLTPLTYPNDYWKWHKDKGLLVYALVPYLLQGSAHSQNSQISEERSKISVTKPPPGYKHVIYKYFWLKLGWQLLKIPLRIKRQKR